VGTFRAVQFGLLKTLKDDACHGNMTIFRVVLTRRMEAVQVSRPFCFLADIV
jgi:hypothetical protein